MYEASGKEWMARIEPVDENLTTDGRVIEVLSEHMCQGWLEGYLLTGRHGFFSCYEAFIHIVDSMFNQHAKWLKVSRHLPWRAPIASLNYLLSSHVWRQDHNGFSHQDPGFIDHVANKKADVVRIYLPPDANYAAFGDGSLLTQPELRKPDHCRQAAGARYGSTSTPPSALHEGPWSLGMGEQRKGRRSGRGDGVRRRCSHAGDSGGGDAAALVCAGYSRYGW